VGDETLIARVADMCFWFGRYVERAESTVRMLAATASMALDTDLPPAQIWRPVVVVSGEEPAFRTQHDDSSPAWGDGEVVQRFMVWERDNGASLVSSIEGARWNARSIREVLSLEAWEVINELHLWLPAAAAQYRDHRDGFYQHVRRNTQLALGLLRSTMLHDEPLDFIWLGVLLERVNQTARMLDVHHHAFGGFDGNELLEHGLWLALLRGLSGSEAYVKKSSGRIGADAVARFLVSETAFPRSIAYCVHSAYERLCHIRPPEQHALPGGMSLERLSVLDRWIDARASDERVHEVLTHVVDEIHAICSLLGTELFGGL
jgi:uncharacterized alpha-E superfamily protein